MKSSGTPLATRWKDLAAALLFVLLSVVMTWPLARNLDRAVADPGDPYLNVWILDWDQWATFHQPLSLFDANIFHPATHALAFSENLYGIAIVLMPLRLAGMSPLTAYNLAMLLGFAVCGFGAYVLGRLVTGSAAAGMVAGIFYAFLPYRFTHIVHVQHVWGGWLALTLAALLHYARRPSWRRAAMFGVLFLLNGLTNIHLLLFGTFALAVTIAALRWMGTRRFLPLLCATALAGVLLAPFLWPYVQASKNYGMVRRWRESTSYSARPVDWLASNRVTSTYRDLNREELDPERWLFPGALGLLMATAGAVVMARRDRSMFTVALIWLVIGFFGSLGTHTIFHRFLFLHTPGFRAIRVPARWAAIAYVALAILIAAGTAALNGRRRWPAAILSLAFLLELRAAPLRWFMAIPDAPPVYRWLAEAKPAGGTLELPFNQLSNYLYLLRATVHHRPLLNGTSGFAPPDSVRLQTLLDNAPSGGDVLALLSRMQCSTIIAHADYLDDATRSWLGAGIEARQIHFVRRFEGGTRGDWVFTLANAPHVVTPELQAFMRNIPVPLDSTFGALDTPAPGQSSGPGQWLAGYAFSPRGVREVNLLFEQRQVRVQAILIAEPSLSARLPWYPLVPKPRFVKSILERPPGVRQDTDVQVEIIDGAGKATLLEDRWFHWSDSPGDMR
jgi:hypothetical protein